MRVTTLMHLVVISAAAACTEPPLPVESRPSGPQFIVNGVPTGSDFGAVGLLLFDFGDDGVLDPWCTGSLISSTVFLTAGHCVSPLPPGAQLYVTFAPAVSEPPAPNTIIAAQAFYLHPDFGPNFANSVDLSVVILPAEATAGITPLQVAPVGYLDELAAHGGLRGQLFLNIGYGFSASQQGRPSFEFDGVRKVSKSPFRALTPTWFGLLTNTRATGEGGSCFGDSGGPKFFDENPTLIVAVESWGDAVCRATSFNQRVDIPAAWAFLGQFVSLP